MPNPRSDAGEPGTQDGWGESRGDATCSAALSARARQLTRQASERGFDAAASRSPSLLCVVHRRCAAPACARSRTALRCRTLVETPILPAPMTRGRGGWRAALVTLAVAAGALALAAPAGASE